MVFQNNVLAGAAGSGTDTYAIDQSIRFNDDDSPFLTRTPSSASNRKTFSFSCWLKLGSGTIDSGAEKAFFSARDESTDYYSILSFNGDQSGANQLEFVNRNGGSYAGYIYTTQLFRDPSAWYHIVLNVDTTDAVASERIKLYVNGSRVTDNTYSAPSLNLDMNMNDNIATAIGARPTNNLHFDGYLAEIVFIDGTALDPSSFGEYNSSNIWVPKDVSDLTFGTNGFYLKGDDASNLGKDSSGNDNDFANSLHTFEPSESNGSLSNGNLTTSFASVTNFRGGRGYVGKSSGKWYAEVTIDNRGASGGSGRSSVGITRAASFGSDTSTNAALNSVGAFTYSREGAKEQGTGSGVTSTSTGYDSFSNGDVIGVALNMDDGEVYFYKNGTAQDSGTAAFTGLGSNTYDLIAIGFGGFQSTVNFGATAFSYTPPTGYAAWDTGSGGLLPSDQVLDSPTNNFSTINPIADLNSTKNTLSEGNLKSAGSSSSIWHISPCTQILPSGKWYFEARLNTVSNNSRFAIGLIPTSPMLPANYGNLPSSVVNSSGFSLQLDSNTAGLLWYEYSSGSGQYVTISVDTDEVGTIGQLAIDVDNQKIYAGINGTYYNSSGGADGNPSTGSNPTYSGTSNFSTGPLVPFIGNYINSCQGVLNFGQDGTFAGTETAGGNSDGNGIGNFKYSVPSGFLAICTKNLGS